jgi:hypothetical protein
MKTVCGIDLGIIRKKRIAFIAKYAAMKNTSEMIMTNRVTALPL